MSVQTGTEASPREPNFGGLRVVAFESRMASETARLIERNGGHAIVAPAMREIPLGDNPAALEFAERLLAGQIDIAIFLTGVGVRALFQVMETRHPRAALTAALARIVTAVRGPKPQAALRDYGLEPSLQAPEPNTWRELLEVLTAHLELQGTVRHLAIPLLVAVALLSYHALRASRNSMFRGRRAVHPPISALLPPLTCARSVGQ